MRWIYPLISAVLLIAWLVVGAVARPFGLPMPALGDFFNPARGFWQNAGEGARTEQLSFHLDHPAARGEIHFDERGVPHLIAGSLEAACFLQGYVNAYDRMWQMDISTRATEGALSEVLGESLRERDLRQIHYGYREIARRAVGIMQRDFPKDYAVLVAYADGVNAYLDQLQPADYPVEYKLLGHAPLRWSPYRTALLMKQMSAGLSGRYDDAEATRTLDLIGSTLFNELFPERFEGGSPVVPDGLAPAAPPGQKTLEPKPGPGEPLTQYEPARASESAHPAYGGFAPDPGNGSNNWAVAPQHSNTGAPLLASDPHLGLSFPSVWYEAQITFPGCNARGVGLAGAPGLMMGFNDHIAWGETNVGHDVTDWYRIQWLDSTRNTYRLDGRAVDTEWVYDTLRARDGSETTVATPWTVFGPVPERQGDYAEMAMRWLAHDEPGSDQRPHTSVQTFLLLMQARSYDDYRAALRGYVDPAQNFLFAARNGDIAIRPNGFFPLREPGEGRFIREGDSTANNWPGTIPFAERPVHYNPARGYVSSANQVTTGPAYPYYYLGSFDEYRGRYINRVLDRQPTMNQRRMKELQLDDYSLYGEELAPLLLARIDRATLNADGQRLLRVLSEWDYRYAGDSRGASLLENWSRRLYALAFDEFPAGSGLLRPERYRLTQLLRDHPGHRIFDIDSTALRETAATLTQRAFDEVLDELNGALPPTWATERDAHIDHLANIPGFGSPLITTGGGRTTPRVVGDNFGGSWRMVIELGEEPRGWGALPGGAAGNPGSAYYDNGFAEWEEGRYHELTRWKQPQQPIGSWIFE